MATRPLFMPVFEGPVFVKTKYVDFTWFQGQAKSQKQKSIDSLHQSIYNLLGISKVLEVSSKSREDLGVALSAFNLCFVTKSKRWHISVESVYQGSKVFESGGPFYDLFLASSVKAKTDKRLQQSGRLIGFCFKGTNWGVEPQTAFYDWLYLNVLNMQSSCILDRLLEYSAFTDIEFNPEKSVTCQAYSVALGVSLYKRNLLESAISSKDAFLRIMSEVSISNARQDETEQASFKLSTN